MKRNRSIHIQLQEYDHYHELSPQDRKLFEQAILYCKNAYAPYSNFHVGAAVLLEDGKIIGGSNQENAAYPSGLCAERVALFAASAQHPGVAIKSIAIVAQSDEFQIQEAVAPCGGCRQVMAEYEKLAGDNIRIIFGNPEGKIIIVESVNDLLPLLFHEEKLKNNRK